MFEIQVHYDTGWETVETISSPERARWIWYAARQRWRTVRLRLLRNSKPVRWRS